LVSKLSGIVAMVTEKRYPRGFLVLFIPFTIRYHHRITGRTPSVGARICRIGVAVESKTRTLRQMLANKCGEALAMVATFNFFVSLAQIRNVVI